MKSRVRADGHNTAPDEHNTAPDEHNTAPDEHDTAGRSKATTLEDKPMVTETSMREVVERLRADASEALIELREFDYALDALLQEVERVAPTVQDLHVVATKVVELRDGEALAWSAVREQTAHLDTWIVQFLTAFRQFRAAVRGWNISPAASKSVLPNSGEGLIPED